MDAHFPFFEFRADGFFIRALLVVLVAAFAIDLFNFLGLMRNAGKSFVAVVTVEFAVDGVSKDYFIYMQVFFAKAVLNAEAFIAMAHHAFVVAGMDLFVLIVLVY